VSAKGTDPGEYRRRMEQMADHAAREEAADQAFERPEPRGSRLAVALGLAAVVVGVGVWNVRVARSLTPPLPAYEQERSLVGVVTVLARQIEGVRSTTGSYPASLDRIAPPLDGVTYRRTDGGYALEAVAGNVVVTFVSDRNPPLLTGRVTAQAEGTR
jgi:hypothetical protein